MTQDFENEYPYVEITWADHYSDFEDGFSVEKIEEMLKKPAIRKTAGYLVGENKRQLAIAGTVEEDGTCSEVFICMKKCVIKRKELQ